MYLACATSCRIVRYSSSSPLAISVYSISRLYKYTYRGRQIYHSMLYRIKVKLSNCNYTNRRTKSLYLNTIQFIAVLAEQKDAVLGIRHLTQACCSTGTRDTQLLRASAASWQFFGLIIGH